MPHNEGWFLLLFPERWWSAILIGCMRNLVHVFLLACISIFLDRNFGHVLILFSSSSMFRVQNESPICVFTADMFATPLTTFELFFYVADLAHLLAEAPSPPPSRTRLFNKLVLDFLDMEAEKGDDSDRHGNPDCWLRLLHLRLHLVYCFCLIFAI